MFDALHLSLLLPFLGGCRRRTLHSIERKKSPIGIVDILIIYHHYHHIEVNKTNTNDKPIENSPKHYMFFSPCVLFSMWSTKYIQNFFISKNHFTNWVCISLFVCLMSVSMLLLLFVSCCSKWWWFLYRMHYDHREKSIAWWEKRKISLSFRQYISQSTTFFVDLFFVLVLFHKVFQ